MDPRAYPYSWGTRFGGAGRSVAPRLSMYMYSEAPREIYADNLAARLSYVFRPAKPMPRDIGPVRKLRAPIY